MNKSQQYITSCFTALADAIIPRTPVLAEDYGRIQYYGAVDSYTGEYLVMSLNASAEALVIPIVNMLDEAAEQLVSSQGNREKPDFSSFPGGGTFSALAPEDRLRALTLLLQREIDPAALPEPFTDNPGFVQYVIGTLNRFVFFGYYTEWSGYGSTRLAPPDQRVLEHFPISWEQVGYPGPSLGYRAFLKQ